MHDELTDIRNQQYENAVRQLENLEEMVKAQEAFLENSNESTHTRSRRMGSDRERTANERLSQ